MGETPLFCGRPGRASARTYFNGLAYCLEHGIVRFGWPETGDLLQGNREGTPSGTDGLYGMHDYLRSYLETFRDLRLGSILLVPDKDSLGDIYIAEVTRAYHYFHDAPKHPYEYAHRVGVVWDRDAAGAPIAYRACDLAISVNGGLWNRALYDISASARATVIIAKIEQQRQCRRGAEITVPAASGPVVSARRSPGRKRLHLNKVLVGLMHTYRNREGYVL